MDGTGQLPISSAAMKIAGRQDWTPNKKRRSRKPQETFRRQNTDSDDVMSDQIEYNQIESLAAVVPVVDNAGGASAATVGQEGFSADAINLFHHAVEMWRNDRGGEQAFENRCGEAETNVVDLSLTIQQFDNFNKSNKHFYAETDELTDNLDGADNCETEEDDQEVAEDDFVEEDFGIYGSNGDQTGSLPSTLHLKEKLPKQLSSSVVCEICDRTFKGRSQLGSHMRTHRRPLHCEICSIKFTSQGTMLWHQRFVHATQKYNHTCEVCGETLRLKQDLMSHYMIHRLSKGVVKCSGCGEGFRNTATLKLHEINACPRHGKSSTIGKEMEKSAAGSADNKVGREENELDEDQSFSYAAAENGFDDERNCDPNDDENLDEKNSTDFGGLMSYTCPFCAQTFCSKGLYTIHTKKHTKPHSCDLCGRGFAKKFTMECHRKTHLGQKDYRCDLCGQAFTLRPQLTKHRAENHEMANGMSCKYCDAKFKHRAMLQRHEAYYCPEASGGKDGEHAGQSGPPESEQELQCDLCDKTFDTKWALEQHAKYHQRKYSCEICGNKYGERFLLQSHLLTHLGVRPYKCTVCGAAFTMKSHCERHCRMHQRAQHFECESCGYMFRYEHDRTTHISSFCLGVKENNADMSKMMSIEKPDFAQLGITSKMLGYTSQPQAKSPLPGSQTSEQSELNISHQEGAPMDVAANDSEQNESAANEDSSRKMHLKCHICGKKFKKRAVLTVHMARDHGIGEEPFKCFVCGQGAAFERAMRLHLESHLPYKMYRCSNCRLRFSNRRSLASHKLHEKCFSSARRPAESIKSESYSNTEIVYVDEDLSLLSLKSYDSEMDSEINTSDKGNLKNDGLMTGNDSGTVCKGSSDSYSEVKIKDEIVDNCCEETNGNPSSSAGDDDVDDEDDVVDDDDDDDDDRCENDISDDDETICDELSLSEDCGDQDNTSVEHEQNQSEDIGETDDKQEDQQSAISENGRLICVIKKEKDGAGYKIQTHDEESLDNSGNILSPDVADSDEMFNDEKRKQLLNVPLHVKVLRDSFGNERVYVNGELFSLWCDCALQASRTGDTGCKDYKEWCEICQRFIVGKYKFRVHMQRHSHDRPFSCDICSKAFKTTENLRTHMRWHDPSRLIVCSLCGAKCVSPSDMKRHMTVHEGVKPYVCSTCGKGFRRKMYLNTHVRTHTGETPFSCDICGRRFRIYSSLHDHQKLHSGYKPFECSVCHKRFAQRANWRTHERRHKGVKNFECEVCQKGFVQNYELQNHRLRCVKQDLPYICLLCGMKFTKEHPLKRHINRHSCGICGKQFVIMKEKVSHQLRCRRRSKSETQSQP